MEFTFIEIDRSTLEIKVLIQFRVGLKLQGRAKKRARLRDSACNFAVKWIP